MSIEFNLDEFDFEAELNNIIKTIEKPNILVCGATGAGKSSLINDVFEDNVARVGEGDPVTRGIIKYSKENMTVNLYDSEGYEVGEDRQTHYKENVLGCIHKYKNDFPGETMKHIHEVWYCISAANKRVTDTDFELINEIVKCNIPIALVITQIDNVDEEELASLISVLNLEVPKLPHFNYCVTDNIEIKEAVREYQEKEKLILWAEKELPEVLKEGLITAIKGNIDRKREMIQNKIIPLYSTGAAATAVSPIPFSDAAILVPIQITMSIHITNVYGIDHIKGAMSSVLSSQITTQVGRMLAKTLSGNLLKFIPGIGSVTGAMINTGVATTITYTLGRTVSKMCYNYSKASIEGKDTKAIDFFSSQAFTDALNSFSHKKGK